MAFRRFVSDYLPEFVVGVASSLVSRLFTGPFPTEILLSPSSFSILLIPGVSFACAMLLLEYYRHRTWRLLVLVPVFSIVYCLAATWTLTVPDKNTSYFWFTSLIGTSISGPVYMALAGHLLNCSRLRYVLYAEAASQLCIIPFILQVPNFEVWAHGIFGAVMAVLIRYCTLKEGYKPIV